jgi:hypothetical protein
MHYFQRNGWLIENFFGGKEDGEEIAAWPRLALNSQSSCLGLLGS